MWQSGGLLNRKPEFDSQCLHFERGVLKLASCQAHDLEFSVRIRTPLLKDWRNW
jgi:hypothetical protein